jgi:hypothetical protein
VSETSKLVLALVFFFVIGIFLTFFQTDNFSRVIGSLALAMACFGVAAVWLKSQGKALFEVSARVKVLQNSKEVSNANSMPLVNKPKAQLSEKSRQQLDRAIFALKSFGVFSPDSPKSEMLIEAIIDYGEPVTLDAVFTALDEANCYHLGFSRSRYDANLAFLPSKTEQLKKTIEAQVLAILALYRDDTVFSDIFVFVADDNKVRITCVLNGENFECVYSRSAKYLSTEPFVALAKHLYKLERTKRLACLWTDQGAYITRLTNGKLGALNKALGKALTVNGTFSWLDEEEGFDAASILTMIKH